MSTLPLTLTPIDNPAARERLERAGDVSASLVESLTSDEIRTLCGNVERDAERGADAHAVPTALLFRLLRTTLTGPREEDPWPVGRHARDADRDDLRREVEHARSAVRGRVGGAW